MIVRQTCPARSAKILERHAIMCVGEQIRYRSDTYYEMSGIGAYQLPLQRRREQTQQPGIFR
jgi:hypothetical protein